MFSRFFIERPIFAIVIAVVMVLAGALTYSSLPVAQYPDITPPTVMVSAVYPGADAKTVAETVGVPIEQQVNGVEGMLYMSSSSGSDGSYILTITFEEGTDLDNATVKVQNRISQAEPQLPTAVKQQGVSVNSESSNQILMIALQSDDPERYDALYLTNYANLNLTDELSRVDGVGNVQAFGGGDYSMRIWLDPAKMRERNVTTSDVLSMIQSQNMEVSAGSVGTRPSHTAEEFTYTLTTRGRLSSPDEFAGIVLRTDSNGNILRLSDIATVDLGSETYTQIARVNDQQSAMIGISQLPGANALDVAKRCESRLEELKEYFPPGVDYKIMLNTTEFVTASLDELLMTFLETTLLVMIVILIFLQNWRAVIIPMLTIPVSLIATLAVMKFMGFTLNTLTLFGLVLAIAIVVDDAIVVVEDCARLLDEGKYNARQAAEKAMIELQGPVVGEVLVLLSVFIPTALVSGITGQLYKQFALTIAVSTAFSGFNALTFTPAMCALFLKPAKPARFFVYKWWNKIFGAATDLYMRVVGQFLKRPVVAILIYFVLTGLAFWGFVKWPTSYVPSEDMGYFMASVQLPTGASLDRTDRIVSEFSRKLLELPEVDDVMGISGYSFLGGGASSNGGTLFVILKPWKDRKPKSEHVDAVIAKANEIGASMQEPIIFALNPPAIPGLGMTSGLEMQLLDISNLGASQMKAALDAIRAEADRDPRIASTTTLYEGEVPQYAIDIDRNRVKMQGLSLQDVYSTLSTFMGGAYVNDFVEFGRVFQVNVAADASSRGHIGDILALSVRNAQGKMVPFSTFATIRPSMGEATVNRYNMYNTAAFTATPAKGVSSHEGIVAMEEIVQKAVGDNYGYAWTGEAYQETQSGTTITFVLILAVIVTLLVLAAQYESLTDPLAVIIAMPTAILGTIIGCIFMSQSISIYTQIGIILLLGLSAKNAILIVEYAIDFRKSGKEIREAALDAGRVRFRPIMMTALAFVLGVMPMLFATGAGAASRLSLGTAVVFGMAVNAVVGTLFVPNFWELCQRFGEKYLNNFFHSAKGLDKQQAESDDI
ncbi:MAG: multidrug efflux RND transporter permease subunit [Bacteroidales bacterium]|nr:multidrug efflux RND transporter permease subunit [Bacteroidales bacterium]